jgi:hypothetical protein
LRIKYRYNARKDDVRDAIITLNTRDTKSRRKGVINAKTVMDAKAVITSPQPSHQPITSPWGSRRDYGGAAQLHFPYQ